MNSPVLKLVFVLFLAIPAAASADGQARETVALNDVLDGVAGREGLTFTINAQVSERVVVGQLDPEDVTYAQLHTVLMNNGMAAVEVEDVVNIVPIGTIRQYPLPTLYEPDDSIADDQWVTWIYRTERAKPSMMVPIMRPILPQQGHLVAHPDSNTLMIVDRYANMLRVVELIRAIDENSSASPES